METVRLHAIRSWQRLVEGFPNWPPDTENYDTAQLVFSADAPQDELADAQRSGILTEALLDDYNEIGSAMLDIAEAEKALLAAQEASLDAMQQSTQGIADAWTGSLSYLSDAQKALYLEGYLALPGTEDTNVDGINTTDTMDTVSAAKLAAELALTSTATSEEYQPFFDRYIQELEQVDEDASRTDIVNELIALRAEITDLRESSLDIAIHS